MGQDLHISASVGAVLIFGLTSLAGDFLRRADLALYDAKEQGLGQLRFFRPELEIEVQKKALLAKDLRKALQLNEFETYFQPQVDLTTNRVYGFEGLIRWKHPDRGEIPPTKFIPVAEKEGLISAIGGWVLKDCCSKGRDWIAPGNPPREISVNVSAAQILEANFFKLVQNTLLDTGLPPHLLCLELTESLFIGKSLRRVKQTLGDLKSLGILLALDDFGTGSGSRRC